MTFPFEQTLLWKRTLAPQNKDHHEQARSKLRNAFLAMRSNASELVKMIPQDCKGLTVHDITHLDALWDVGDLIAGPDFDINPVEAFVFGAAALLHDAGMSVASYPSGMSEIMKTTEWADTLRSIVRQKKIAEDDAKDLSKIPGQLKDELIFNVLRALHAKHAEELVSVAWRIPGKLDEVRLLEDQHLRAAYGRSVGLIAHSHHWSLEQVVQDLRTNVGAATELPGTWALNEAKMACLLRCADAAHIDHRRAPSMLYALTQPQGISDEHWNFQNKLNKPIIRDGVLMYSAGQDFRLAEANSWWLCYEAVRLIDRELTSCNAYLQDSGLTTFIARRVYGADNPLVLAQQIRPSGWRPVNAEIRVSDPVHLAKTLGGRSLYGRSAFAPIRELLQNAVDAVRARRRHEDRASDWGHVKLMIEELSAAGSREVWLHVDDTGVGMSERVLTGPLLDFGRSLWNSALLREEFPGLESRGIQPIGKFGIGFFSVFLLGKKVKIISRRYDKSLSETLVLEFDSVSARPIVRKAELGELPLDYVTRVSVRLDMDSDVFSNATRDVDRDVFLYSQAIRRSAMSSLEEILKHVRQLIAAVDVDVMLTYPARDIEYLRDAHWTTSSPDLFLEELLAPFDDRAETIINVHSHLLSLISENNIIYGRGALAIYIARRRNYMFGNETANLSFVSVGGFLYPTTSRGLGSMPSAPMIGVLTGETEDVSRQSAIAEVPPTALSSWAEEQASRLNRARFDHRDQMKACHAILDMSGDPQELPFCFCQGSFISLNQFLAIVKAESELWILLKAVHENIAVFGITNLTSSLFTCSLVKKLMVVETIDSSSGIFSEEYGKMMLASKSSHVDKIELGSTKMPSSIRRVAALLRREWGMEPQLCVRKAQIIVDDFYVTPEEMWVMSLTRVTP